MKKVLIITYYWPPSGGAGVQRWLKFAKYLPKFNIEPVVLTVDLDYASYAQRDESLLNEVATDCKVFRTKSVEVYNLYKKITRSKEIPYGGFANESNPSLLQKISRFIRGNFFFPDPRRGWNKYALQKAKELIRTYQIDTVITTSPPHSTQLIGLKLKKQLGIRWIADLRDPWTNIYYNNMLAQTLLAKKINKKMELKVLKSADQIVTVSRGFKDMFAGYCPKIKNKIAIVYNGFDESDIVPAPKTTTDRYVITYGGTIADSYNLQGFIESLVQFPTSIKQKLLIRFVGKISAAQIEGFKKAGLGENLEIIDYVKHDKLVRYLIDSDILLLVIPDVANNEGIVPGKLFEYLATGVPVLALGPENGDISAILKKVAGGEAFEPAKPAEIYSFLKHVLAQKRDNKPSPNLNDFSRRSLAMGISEVIIKK